MTRRTSAATTRALAIVFLQALCSFEGHRYPRSCAGPNSVLQPRKYEKMRERDGSAEKRSYERTFGTAGQRKFASAPTTALVAASAAAFV